MVGSVFGFRRRRAQLAHGLLALGSGNGSGNGYGSLVGISFAKCSQIVHVPRILRQSISGRFSFWHTALYGFYRMTMYVNTARQA